tara:strand:- start:49 stop:1035 length:987 start_codon:yes stop_codon:yes gene_type:complete
MSNDISSLNLQEKWDKLIDRTTNNKSFVSGGEIKAHDQFWFITNNNHLPGLEIRLKQNIKIDTKLLPQARNWTVKTLGNKIIMELKREEYQEIFIKTLNLILTIIILKKIESEESIKKFLSILNDYKEFFEEEHLPRPLKLEAQLGLFGEIFILSQILIKKLKASEALNTWTGPSKSLDFSTTNSFIEVKTSAGENLINTTDSQINPNHDKQLFLSFLKIKKDEGGSNLNELIEAFSENLKKSSEEDYNSFLLKLMKVGYFEIHRDFYLQKFNIDKTLYYSIEKNFPFIDKAKIIIPDGIEKIKLDYKINLDKCSNFLINENDFLSKI